MKPEAIINLRYIKHKNNRDICYFVNSVAGITFRNEFVLCVLCVNISGMKISYCPVPERCILIKLEDLPDWGYADVVCGNLEEDSANFWHGFGEGDSDE